MHCLAMSKALQLGHPGGVASGFHRASCVGPQKTEKNVHGLKKIHSLKEIVIFAGANI